jgi:hypothetical protein
MPAHNCLHPRGTDGLCDDVLVPDAEQAYVSLVGLSKLSTASIKSLRRGPDSRRSAVWLAWCEHPACLVASQALPMPCLRVLHPVCVQSASTLWHEAALACVHLLTQLCFALTKRFVFSVRVLARSKQSVCLFPSG